MEKKDCAGSWISLLLRLSIASLFFVAAIGKFKGGLDGVVTSFQQMFASTWLPMPLVTMQARVTPFIEALIPVWLMIGLRLKEAWIVTGLFLVSLAFGMMVAGKYDIAGNNYVYVLFACAGLYFAGQDKLSVDGLSRKDQ